MSYAAAARPPRTLTDAEVRRILDVTGKHRDGFRDHVIISLALGCALRQSEIIALDVSDVSADGKLVRRVLHLRTYKRSSRDPSKADQRVRVPDLTHAKLANWLKINWGDGGAPSSAPLFAPFHSNQNSNGSGRLSDRGLRDMFAAWQRRAGFDHLYNFHALRHTAISTVRRRTGDIRLAQRFARHANIATTAIYDHPSDEELAAAVKGLPG